MDKLQLKKIRAKHGEPVHYNDKGKLVGLNEYFFAALFLAATDIFYHKPIKAFVKYMEDTGIWKSLEPKDTLNEIASFMVECNKVLDIEISRYCKLPFYKAVSELLQGLFDAPDIFKSNSIYIHCNNCVLEWNAEIGDFEIKEFSKHFFSRHALKINFDPNAKCPRFINELLKPALSSEEDMKLFQLYCGQCLLGRNFSQTILLLLGLAGSGKSTLLNILELILDRAVCTEIRLSHITSRFEVSRLIGAHLIAAKDVKSNFLYGAGASTIKSLTGKDVITAELKNSNEVLDVVGNFNVIITSNAMLRINLDSDQEAWFRRLLLIEFNTAPDDSEKIVDFDELLLKEEGPGILNFFLQGARELLLSGGIITKTPLQKERINNLLHCSNSFELFAVNSIKPSHKHNIATREVVSLYAGFCQHFGWPVPKEQIIQKELKEYMARVHNASIRTNLKRNGINSRGYSGFELVIPQGKLKDPDDNNKQKMRKIHVSSVSQSNLLEE